MRRWRWLVGSCLVLLACADMTPLASDACGNGVVDEREDCDSVAPGTLRCGSPSDSLRACRFTCGSAADCSAGWACSRDGVCVHGTGQFSEGAPVVAEVDAFELGDVDGDGLVDLAATHGRRLEVRYGDGTGRFGDARSRPIDRIAGRPPWLGDADGDGILEAAVPTPWGIVLLRGGSRLGFLPLSYASVGYAPQKGMYEDYWATRVAMPPAYQRPSTSPWHGAWDTECDGMLALGVSQNILLGLVTPVPLEVPKETILAPIVCDDDTGAIGSCLGARVIRLPRPATAPDTEGETLVVMRTSTAWPGLFKIALVDGVPRPVDWHALELPAGLTIVPDARPLAGPTGSAAEWILFIPVADDKGRLHVVSALRDAQGTLSDFAVDPHFEPGAPCTPSEPGAVPLAAADLDGDGELDFVMPHGLCKGAAGSEPFELVASFGVKWDDAVTADFDGNGTTDVAGVRSDGLGIEIVYLDGKWGEVTGSLDTGSKPRLLHAAQLDGLGGWDLAYADSTGDDYEKVQVAFGEQDGMTQPETVALAVKVKRIESAKLRDVLGQCDEAMDLAVTVEAKKGDYTVVPLLGSADRAIYAPVVLGSGSNTELPVDVVLGRASSPGQGWMLAVAEGKGAVGSTFGSLYALGDALGGGVSQTTHAVLAAASCGKGSAAFSWTMADIDGDGADEAVGVEGTEACAPASGSVGARVEWTSSTLALHEQPLSLALGPGRELVAADLDHDGFVDLALARADGLFVFWGAGPTDGWPSAPRQLASSARSLALLDADGSPGKELACLTDEALVVFAFDGREPVELARYETSQTASLLRSGDVNGDAVDDLVVADGSNLRPFLGTPHLTTPVPGP